ncbi:MAG TPA: hypothetical protein VFW62_06105, partial [bacterium]|nr:hypothetical protein [bacterium]
DIRQLEGFEETVMVKVPPPEDSDLHDIQFFDQEKTGEHEAEPPAPSPGPAPRPPAVTQDMEATTFFEMPEVEEEPAVESAPPPKAKAPEPVQAKAPEPARTLPPVGPAPVAAPILASAKPKRSLIYLLLSLVFFLFLAEGTVEALSRGAGLRLPAILATALAGLFLAGALLRRLEGRHAFLGVLLAWFGLVAWAGFRFYASDPANLHFFKLGLAFWLGPVWVLVLGIAAAVLFATPRLSFLAKLLGAIAFLLGLVAWIFALIGGQGLEGGLWGAPTLSAIPLWLRPGVLSMALSFPLLFLAIILGWVLGRKQGQPFLRRGAWALLAIAMVGSLLGWKLLSRQGMRTPGAGIFTGESFYGVTWLDPLTSPIRLQVLEGRPLFNSPEGMPLRVAATRSSPSDKGRQSRLMVRNQEGLSFAPGVAGHLALSRGDKPMRGVQVEVDGS